MAYNFSYCVLRLNIILFHCFQSTPEPKDENCRKTTDTVEDLISDIKPSSKKKTNQLYKLPPHKIRNKKISKSTTPSCTGGGVVVEHEKEKSMKQSFATDLLDPTQLIFTHQSHSRLPDKIDLPKLALDQLSNCSSNNSPRNFVLSPRSQKSLFTTTQSPLASGKYLC